MVGFWVSLHWGLRHSLLSSKPDTCNKSWLSWETEKAKFEILVKASNRKYYEILCLGEEFFNDPKSSSFHNFQSNLRCYKRIAGFMNEIKRQIQKNWVTLEQCCPTLSPFDTCGDRQLFKYGFLMINNYILNKLWQRWRQKSLCCHNCGDRDNKVGHPCLKLLIIFWMNPSFCFTSERNISNACASCVENEKEKSVTLFSAFAWTKKFWIG